LRGFDSKSIARTLFGPVWITRAKQGPLLDRPRAKVHAQEGREAERERAKGTNVAFPREYAYPGFLLEKMLLSVEKGGANCFTGSLEGVTSDPRLYGKPRISSSSARPERRLQGDA